MAILEFLSNLIAPPYCTYCKKYLSHQTPLCTECYAHAIPVLPTHLKLTATHTVTIYARSEYKDPLRPLILAKGRSNYLASTQLAEIMLDMPFFTTPIDYFIPVPLHWTRYAARGFNQADVIATTLGTKLSVPVVSCIKRVQKTPQQSTCGSAQERAQNVENAFALTSTLDLSNKHIVIIDDLMTTGATLSAVAKTLLPLKPARISAVVACRVCA